MDLSTQLSCNKSNYKAHEISKLAYEIDLMDESDRGAVIVGADMISNELTDLLLFIFKRNGVSKKIINEIFSLNGPLANLSSKISICYSFGVIDRGLYDDLNKVRRFRNNLSHSSGVFDFTSNDVTELLMEIDVFSKTAKSCNHIKRYSFNSNDKDDSHGVSQGEALKFWESRSMGYVSYNKMVFVLGVHKLLHEILMAKKNVIDN
ncbi:hypothetical protein EFZ62_14830 [Serratia marcescens]|nr:hypothetical protein EFZ62_14830 [Serratia marcescens]